MDNTTDISSPAYFAKTFGVDAAQAADLSAQAKFVSVNKGGGITAEAPGVPAPVAPSAPAVAPSPGTPAQPATLSAKAEFDQLWADRAAGKISNFAWNDKAAQAHRDALVARIADGDGAQPAPVTQAVQPTALDALFAPPAAPSDYRFPYSAATPTDEQMAEDSTLKVALHAAQMPKSLVESIAVNLRSSVAAEANETPAALQSRLDAQKARLTAMWAKSGEGTFDANMVIVDTFLEQLGAKHQALRNFIANAAPRLTPMDIDSLLQLARQRGVK